jgi:hypothetical protein
MPIGSVGHVALPSPDGSRSQCMACGPRKLPMNRPKVVPVALRPAGVSQRETPHQHQKGSWTVGRSARTRKLPMNLHASLDLRFEISNFRLPWPTGGPWPVGRSARTRPAYHGPTRGHVIETSSLQFRVPRIYLRARQNSSAHCGDRNPLPSTAGSWTELHQAVPLSFRSRCTMPGDKADV